MGCLYGLHLNWLIREGNHFTRAGSRPAKASTFGASKFKSDIFRPTVRVTKDTPTTFAELTTEEIAKARREKARTVRVGQVKDSNKDDIYKFRWLEFI